MSVSISKQISDAITDKMVLYISLRESNDDRKYDLLSEILIDIENIVKISKYYNGNRRVIHYYFNTVLDKCEKNY